MVDKVATPYYAHSLTLPSARKHFIYETKFIGSAKSAGEKDTVVVQYRYSRDRGYEPIRGSLRWTCESHESDASPERRGLCFVLRLLCMQ